MANELVRIPQPLATIDVSKTDTIVVYKDEITACMALVYMRRVNRDIFLGIVRSEVMRITNAQLVKHTLTNYKQNEYYCIYYRYRKE